MSLDIAILAYVILPTSSVHVITEPNTLQLAWYIRGPFFAPYIDVLNHLLWFLGEYILFQADLEGCTSANLRLCSINVSIA